MLAYAFTCEYWLFRGAGARTNHQSFEEQVQFSLAVAVIVSGASLHQKNEEKRQNATCSRHHRFEGTHVVLCFPALSGPNLQFVTIRSVDEEFGLAFR